jgi:hypothetical protein
MTTFTEEELKNLDQVTTNITFIWYRPRKEPWHTLFNGEREDREIQNVEKALFKLKETI